MTIDPGLPVALAVVLLLGVTVAVYVLGRLPRPASPVLAMARAIGQLGVAALVITAVVRSLPLSVVLLVVHVHRRRLTTVRRVEARAAWPWATVAMLAGLLPVVVVVLATRTVPPTGLALVPVVGIIAGNTMNGHTLTCRRAFAALREEHGQYEAALSLGLTRAQAVEEVVHRGCPRRSCRAWTRCARPGSSPCRGPSSGCSSAEALRPRQPPRRCSSSSASWPPRP